MVDRKVDNRFSGNADVVVQAGEVGDVHITHVHVEPDDHVTQAARRLARAVDAQWRAEAAIRGLFGGEPIPVDWDTENGGATGTVRPEPARGAELPGYFRRLEGPGRLVILGPAGAGKTSTAVLLLLGLLTDRRPDQPVPVLLALDSWDPATEHVTTWMHRRLTEDYPTLGRGRHGLKRAAQLLDSHLILPVLDGLDELPAARRAAALRGINRILDDRTPLVLTCRTAEYHALDHEGFAVPGAAVIRARPVGPEAVRRYLTAPGGSEQQARWRHVLDLLQDEPQGPLARTLANPALLALARTVYGAGSGREPAALAALARTATADRLADHLLSNLVPTVFDTGPVARNAPAWWRRQWTPEQSRRWLAFLARESIRLGGNDLAWWRLESYRPPGVTGVDIGLTVTAGFALVVTATRLIGGSGVPWGFLWGSIGTVGLSCGVIARLGASNRQRFGGIGMDPLGVVLGSLLGGVAFLLLGWAGHGFGGMPLPLLALGGLAYLTMLPLQVVQLVQSRREVDAEAMDPHRLMRRQRRSSLALLAATFAGILAVNHLLATAAVHLGVGFADTGLPVAYSQAAPVVSLPLGVLFASRWGAYSVVRVRHALWGRLPWRLMRFLQDAHQRGVLQQVGAVYQFRHVRLRDTLAKG
ncbi:hypothetical protein [Kitasatospora sp. NPDC096140]|uniref:hypothetical protein n=1 Tax=Kitasatospora sp. NPDC096140 TaxID=3155425 RepID=UPI003331CED5